MHIHFTVIYERFLCLHFHFAKMARIRNGAVWIFVCSDTKNRFVRVWCDCENCQFELNRMSWRSHAYHPRKQDWRAWRSNAKTICNIKNYKIKLEEKRMQEDKRKYVTILNFRNTEFERRRGKKRPPSTHSQYRFLRDSLAYFYVYVYEYVLWIVVESCLDIISSD